MYYTNIIVIKDIIILENIKKKKKRLKNIINITVLLKNDLKIEFY